MYQTLSTFGHRLLIIFSYLSHSLSFVRQVPLLYSARSSEEAAVALIMHPSIYPPGHKKYKGPILFNPGKLISSIIEEIGVLTTFSRLFWLSPGGPGGSGVELLVLLWRAFRVILGDEFDLVSFDPRGLHYLFVHF